MIILIHFQIRTTQFLQSKTLYVFEYWWIAKNREILRSLPVSKFSSKIVNLELDEIPIERALGLLRNPLNDLLQIKAVNKTLPTSKRDTLSFISFIFDPLEIFAPATLEPKLIVQELWKQKLAWRTFTRLKTSMERLESNFTWITIYWNSKVVWF